VQVFPVHVFVDLHQTHVAIQPRVSKLGEFVFQKTHNRHVVSLQKTTDVSGYKIYKVKSTEKYNMGGFGLITGLTVMDGFIMTSGRGITVNATD